MIDVGQFKDLVIAPALINLDMYSDSAVKLLLGTALQESKLTHVKQIGGGPALGVYQMEPATHNDIWVNYINYKPWLEELILGRYVEGARWRLAESDRVIYDLRYATAMARIHYARRPEPLPDVGDDIGMAHYWKDHYNTHLGAGTVEEYLACWEKYGIEG